MCDSSFILASSSIYRSRLLQRLQLPFQCFSPDIDETPEPEETPEAMVLRLSKNKARAAASQFTSHYIIASDQCAVFNGEIIGKPGSHSRAVAQLQRFSGKDVTFYTGLVLLNSQTASEQATVEPFQVSFRELSLPQIEGYLQIEQPYDCAGSFKVEGLGITLFKRLCGDDPNSLIGLPLIQLTTFLANEGIVLPQFSG